MEQKPNDLSRYGGKATSRIWSGFLLIAAGVLLLAYKMGAPIPHWIFTWPVLLIAIGLLTGMKSRFRNPGASIMIAVGGVFLIDQTHPEFNFHNYILPAILIAVGFIYVFRPKNNCSGSVRRKFQNTMYDNASATSPAQTEYVDLDKNKMDETDEEYLKVNAVLGGVNKIMLSKNFQGGEINCFMGGSEINLMQADIQHPVVLEVSNIFAGTKLIVPANWYVKNEINVVFGGVEDKRNVNNQTPDPSRILRLKGNCVFGGIEISNY